MCELASSFAIMGRKDFLRFILYFKLFAFQQLKSIILSVLGPFGLTEPQSKSGKWQREELYK